MKRTQSNKGWDAVKCGCVDLSAGLLWGLGTDRVQSGQVEAVHSELVEVMKQRRGQMCALTRTLRPCEQKPWSVWGWLLIGRPDSEGKKYHTHNLLHDRSKQLFSLVNVFLQITGRPLLNLYTARATTLLCDICTGGWKAHKWGCLLLSSKWTTKNQSNMKPMGQKDR